MNDEGVTPEGKRFLKDTQVIVIFVVALALIIWCISQWRCNPS